MRVETSSKAISRQYRTNRVTFKATDEELKMFEAVQSRLKAKSMSDALRKLIRYEFKKTT